MSWQEDQAAAEALSGVRAQLEGVLTEVAVHGIAELARAAFPQAKAVFLSPSDQDYESVVYGGVFDIEDNELLSQALVENFEDAMGEFTCHLRQYLVDNAPHVAKGGLRNDPYWGFDIEEVLE